MGILKQVEDPLTGAILKTFLGSNGRAVKPVGNMGWERRNATIEMANIPFGASPFGNFAAPMKTRKWPWQVRVYAEGGFDSARDALNAAVGQGWPVRLVYAHDDGYERVCENAVAYVSDQPFSADAWLAYDFNVQWELNSYWTERHPVDATLRMGQGYLMGQGHVMGEGSSTAVINADPFNVPTTMVDGAVAGPGGIPNIPDTGPIITIVGPVGGSLGFTLANLSDRFAWNFGNGVIGGGFNFTLPIGAGHILTIDCGAKSVTFDGPTDFSQYLSEPITQPHWLAIYHQVANQLRLKGNGNGITTGGSINISWSRYWL